MHLNPNWGGGCPDRAACDINIAVRNRPDIVIFDVKEETPDIPSATLDVSRVYAGDRVVMTGYGCESGFNVPASFSRRFKYYVTETRTVEEVRRVVSADVGNAFLWNIVTPGISTEPSSASLCPGDSGGPLYRDDGTELTLVGINTYVDFLEPNSPGISAYNWHTRLEKIQTWLQSLPWDHQ